MTETMTPDLHMHTTSSDGLLSPRELVRRAAASGVTLMAITDHDSLDGVDSLRGVETEIPVLTGTELSLRDMHGLHLLGYGMGDAAEFRSVIHDLADKRRNRARRMVEKLTALGMPIDYDELCAHCGGSVGRMHIAREMLAKGYVRHTQQAFDRWIGEDGPAYESGERLNMAEALELMRRCGFVPVLAHPAELELPSQALTALLEKWQGMGLLGVEVYHLSQRKFGFDRLDSLARRMGLLVTGGSDFHAEGDARHGMPGCTAVYWRRAEDDVAALLSAMKEAQKKP